MDSTATGDTRARIQQIALELFTEHGYDKTSLREIAERLGVTKAALYYHFKSKEEIVESFIQDSVTKVDELIAWLAEQPRTLETRREFVQRYSEAMNSRRQHNLMRFFESNQAAMRSMSAGLKMRDRFVEMLKLLSEPGASLADQLRSGLSVWVLHASWFFLRDVEATTEERQAAALEVALDLVDQSATAVPEPAATLPAARSSTKKR